MDFRLLLVSLFLVTSANAAETRYFESDGIQLRYFDEGDGETVILLHGFSGSAQGLYINPGTFDALVNAGYRVVALDQRGHGGSDKPHATDAYGQHFVLDVRRLIDHLDVRRVHLVGYSMGAMISNAFRAQHPDKLLSVTLGGYGWPWQRPQISYEESLAFYRDRDVLPGNDRTALAAVRMGRHELDVDRTSLMTNKIPVFVINGDQETVVPEVDQRTVIETMANVESAIIPGTHAGPDGAPYKPVFAEKLIAFLDDN